MKKLWSPLLVLVLPGAALASGGPDLGTSVMQMLGSLILVVGIILVLYYLAGRYLKLPQVGNSRYIRVVETRHLAPKKSLVLVEVGGKYLLLSNSGEGINLISKVDLIEEIEVVEESAPLMAAQQLKMRLTALAKRRQSMRKNSGGLVL
jgi:flagellar protein FliO/FliZ